MRKLSIIALVMCFALGCLFGASVIESVYAQFVSGKIAPGVYVSEFPDGTKCYTNNAGGIFCIN